MRKGDDFTNRIYSTIPDNYHSKRPYENGISHVSGRKELYESLDKRNDRVEAYDTLKPSKAELIDPDSKSKRSSVKDCVLVVVMIILLCSSVAVFVMFVNLSDRVSSQLDHINTIEGNLKGEMSKLYKEVNNTQGKFLTNDHIDHKVAFTAIGASGKMPVSFKEVIHNYGNAFSGSSGKFTCPTAGIYFFVSLLSFQDDLIVNMSLKCYIYINNQEGIGSPVYELYDNVYAANLVATFYLEVDDVVYLGCRNGDGFRRVNFSSLTGFLVAYD